MTHPDKVGDGTNDVAEQKHAEDHDADGDSLLLGLQGPADSIRLGWVPILLGTGLCGQTSHAAWKLLRTAAVLGVISPAEHDGNPISCQKHKPSSNERGSAPLKAMSGGASCCFAVCTVFGAIIALIDSVGPTVSQDARIVPRRARHDAGSCCTP